MTDKTEAQILALLETDLLHAPADFSQRISAKIDHDNSVDAPTDSCLYRTTSNGYAWWQWLAMISGSVLGGTQVARFIFGYWLSVAAT